ncbi:MAG: DUF1592 domain-containing protein [Candidatus Poribacteria bacterium]|nr:DUF1592 domain-containing protein [Candidatus Poribacteria bacterium]
MRCGAIVLIAYMIVFVGAGCSTAEVRPDFADSGKPFLTKHCVSCHGGKEPVGGLALDAFHDSASVIARRKVWDNVLKMVRIGAMPPAGLPQPSADEVAHFVAHVNEVFADADQRAEPNPGRVTMRRLNRVEYKNTVRDLIGVDFDPTENFPSDDIGHGFDNIGDVLTLSPVLMERYLAAAESIADRAILPDPPKPPKRHTRGRYTEPASDEVEKLVIEDGWRRLSTDGAKPIETGPINAPYPFEDDAEYVFRTRVYAKSAPPVRVAVLEYGEGLSEASSEEELSALAGNAMRPAKILQTFEIHADKQADAQTLEIAMPPKPGRQRIMIALVKPTEGEPPAQISVDYMLLEGPLDTRPASHRRLLARDEDKPQIEQTREVLGRFLRRAYRRPSTDDELERLVSLVEGVVAAGEKWESGIQLAVQATLCSPKFLFRVELDDRPTNAGQQSLDDLQLASRLSYFLWSTMPDDELLELAEQHQLSANIDAQVRRMLADPKSQALVENFALQWLQLQRIKGVAPDNTLFPAFNDRLRAAMLDETTLFFESVMREDRSVLDLIDADYTFLNEPLARHYGIIDTNGTLAGQEPVQPGGSPIEGREFQRISLQGRRRGGLLTQASVLTVTSNPTRTSPVKRGRWVLEQILGEPPPPPPPDVPDLPEDEQATSGSTLRERMEIHRRNPSCANCHKEMDAIGFALENYDAVGAFRTKDGKFDIDSSGEFADGTTFQGAEDLKRVIGEKKAQFARCLTEKMMTYALGRGMEYYDAPNIEQIVEQLALQDYTFSALVTEIVTSDPFRKRRGAGTVNSID